MKKKVLLLSLALALLLAFLVPARQFLNGEAYGLPFYFLKKYENPSNAQFAGIAFNVFPLLINCLLIYEAITLVTKIFSKMRK